MSPLLARRTEFTVPSRTVRAIGTPGADEVNAVELECGICDSAARPRPTTHPRDRSHVTTAVDRTGNVPERLEFTVIGAAANEAARLEGFCKTLNQPLLISSAFEGCFPGVLVSLGFQTLRGVSAPEEIFTLPADEA